MRIRLDRISNTRNYIFLFAFWISFFPAWAHIQKTSNDQRDSISPILVQGAADIEVQSLVTALTNFHEITDHGWTFWQGTIEDFPVVISRTEIGMTNAAVATVLGIEKFHPRLIINQGTAGGHDPTLHLFDIVLSQSAIHYSAFKTKHRDLGQGVGLFDWVILPTLMRYEGAIQKIEHFDSDATILEQARQVPYAHGHVVVGVMATSNQWNRELDFIQMLHERYNTSAEDMETASVAQVVQAFGVPFLGVRIISNSEPNNEAFDPIAGFYAQEYTLEIIKTEIGKF